MRPPNVGLSDELIEHHADQHPCQSDGCYVTPCPCGSTIAISCDACREPVFVAVAPGTWCGHAESAWQEQRRAA